MIPVIDLFAGPGGLGEGFSAFRPAHDKGGFRIALSIESDPRARDTLRLRSFFRQFVSGAPGEYYDFLRGKLRLETLYNAYPDEARRSDKEAWLATLANPKKNPLSEVDARIKRALDGAEDWVLIGGPPCQAYSLVGRSRMAQQSAKYQKDDRHFLYKEYLRIIAIHRPPVFVMENVKGILSSKVKGDLIIDQILSDLRSPSTAIGESSSTNHKARVTYTLHTFSDYGQTPPDAGPSRYVIRCERHGIPQARHRLILLGVRSDLHAEPTALRASKKGIPMWNVIGDLPPLRSQLSKGKDSPQRWLKTIQRVTNLRFSANDGFELDVWKQICKFSRELGPEFSVGGEFVPWDDAPDWKPDWFHDSRLEGVCNHATRAHLSSDLWRYFFAICFAKARKRSPLLTDFPDLLLPDHENAMDLDDDDEVKFPDRFRVQVENRPSTTVTSHIAKDGHYFIHPDPVQCRSLTVREAARLQTFPDNYFFMGPRTEQYRQVGNAVPPLLAKRLARVVSLLLA